VRGCEACWKLWRGETPTPRSPLGSVVRNLRPGGGWCPRLQTPAAGFRGGGQFGVLRAGAARGGDSFRAQEPCANGRKHAESAQLRRRRRACARPARTITAPSARRSASSQPAPRMWRTGGPISSPVLHSAPSWSLPFPGVMSQVSGCFLFFLKCSRFSGPGDKTPSSGACAGGRSCFRVTGSSGRCQPAFPQCHPLQMLYSACFY
jgi:hypothetical protein